jgi:NADPH:quinone reductase-like Zn-dependent oxidoreductase
MKVMMRAMMVAQNGGKLQVIDRPLARPGPGKVLVKVACAE